MVFEELSVTVDAATSGFSAGMNRVDSALDSFQRNSVESATAAEFFGEALDEAGGDALQAAGAMEVARRQTDDLGDEMTELSIKGGAASSSLNFLSTSAAGSSASLSTLSSVMTVSLIPAVGILSTALVPLISALGGLAAIGASIAGIGLVGTIAAVSQRTETLQNRFSELSATFATEFEPAIDVATEVLLILMDELEAIASELVPSEEALSEMGGAFADLGSIIINSLPAFVDLAVTLTREFLPPFNQFLRDILPRLPGMILTMVRSFERLIPSIMQAGRSLAQFLPQLLEFGFTVLNLVGPALGNFFAGLNNAVSGFNQLDTNLQNIIVTLTSIAPVFTALAILLSGPVALAVGGIVAAFTLFRDEIVGFAQEWINTYEPSIRSTFQRLLQIGRTVWPGIKDFIADVAPAVAELSGELLQLVDAILPIVQSVAPGVSRALGGLGDILSGLIGFLTTIIQLLTGDFDEALNTFEESVRSVVEGTGQVIEAGFESVASATETAVEGVSGNTVESVQQQRSIAPTGQFTQAPPSQTDVPRIILEEETDVVNARIESGAEGVIERRERQRQRNTGINQDPR